MIPISYLQTDNFYFVRLKNSFNHPIDIVRVVTDYQNNKKFSDTRKSVFLDIEDYEILSEVEFPFVPGYYWARRTSIPNSRWFLRYFETRPDSDMELGDLIQIPMKYR